VTLGGRRVRVERPRMRTKDGQSEVPLATYERFTSRDALSRAVLERMLAGVSTRRYRRVPEPVGTGVEARARSTSKSAEVAYVKDAAGHTNYVIVRDGLYIPQTQAIPLESGTKKSPPTVRWVFEGPRVHTATDATGMGLYDSGAESPVAIFAHTFTTAGSFHLLLLPEVLCETFEWNRRRAMRPVLDALWQASGRDGSPSYTPDGDWKPIA
jgi:hypothetical protein